jgi:CRISPR system Cascade subunit CasE
MYLTQAVGCVGHREVMSGFPLMESLTPRSDLGILFRHDGDMTLIQSKIPFVHDRIRFQQKEVEINPIDGRDYYFRVAINAVSRKGGKRDRKVSPEEWFSGRDFGADFSLESAVHFPGVFESKSNKVPINRYSIGGMLTVKDSDRLRHAILEGIGRGKAWGCGLLSIVET